MWGALSDSYGSVIYSYNCFWASPEQSLSGPCPTELGPYSTALLILPQPGGPSPRIYGLSIVLYMRSLLPVENVDLRPNNQYILVRGFLVVSVLRRMFVSGKSPVQVYPEILDIFFLGELHVVYMELFSSCSGCDVN
jgi:hypothetical protein